MKTPPSTMVDPLASIPDESERRGELLVRTLPILLLPFVVAIAIGVILTIWLGAPMRRAAFEDDPSRHFVPLVFIVGLPIFFTALVTLVRLGRTTLSAVLLIGLWTLISTFFTVSNGINDPGPAVLIIPICTAGLLIDGAASISLAALDSILVGALGWLQIQGIRLIPNPPGTAPDSGLPLPWAIGFWIGLYWSVAALTYLLASGVQRALNASRAQAQALGELSTQLEQRVEQQTAELVEQSLEAARLEERARVARDIHDTLAQGLTGIVVQLGAAQRALQRSAPDAGEHLDLAQGMAREALAEARRSIWNLRVPALERGNLSDALQGLAARRSRPETKIDFELRGEPWTLSSEVESSLLRVCQEALVNISRHAGATEGRVVLEYAPDAVRLTIRDNGAGFDQGALESEHHAQGPWDGFGLLGMRERISALGGTLKLWNDGGAQVQAVISRARAEATEAQIHSDEQVEGESAR